MSDERITINYYFMRHNSSGLDEITYQEYGALVKRGDLRKRINHAIDTAKKHLRSGMPGAQATIVYRSNPVASVRGRTTKRYNNQIAAFSKHLPE